MKIISNKLVSKIECFAVLLLCLVLLNLVSGSINAGSFGSEVDVPWNSRIMDLGSLQADNQEIWGGSGIIMSVLTDGASIEFDCAEAEINEQLSTVAGDSFDLEGTYLRRAPGPIREKFQPKRQMARFEGEISEDVMTLKITLVENEDLIGNFTLERGKAGRIRRCL